MKNDFSVKVRMYKMGELGDCFLLRFKYAGREYPVLIDCGSFRNSKSSVKRVRQVVADIRKQVAESTLRVVVGTHQHNDHLSGFVHAEDIFRTMKPEQVWLSWLDNPADKDAQEIAVDFNNYLTALCQIRQNLNHKDFSRDSTSIKLDEMLGFFGVDRTSVKNASKNAKLPPLIPAQAREILKTLGVQQPAYLSPGQTVAVPGIPEGVLRVHVLGPPRKSALLYDKDPGKGETYDPKLSVNAAGANKLMLAMRKYSEVIKEEDDEEPFPFDEPYRKSPYYDVVWDVYYGGGAAWRKIEFDWLNQVEQLALWLDGFTNNSSLVLAFEMVNSGKVLLFAGDAQTGNWLSWKKLKFKDSKMSASWLDLMKRTVLYKAGHHGSHNATLPDALNNMTHEHLAVMISVDRSDPNIKKMNGWKMPAENLMKELLRKSAGRIVRMDDGLVNKTAWKGPCKAPSEFKLFYEYEIRG